MGKMPTRRRPVGVTDRETRYQMWKDDHVPLLYDWVSSRRFAWPHAAVCWGTKQPALSDNPGGRNGQPQKYSTRAMYLAERTGDTSKDPNTLLYFDVRVVDEHFSQLRDVAHPWVTDATVTGRSDKMSTPEFWLKKRIVHPGEVNKIRLVSPGIVVTVSDNPELYVWNFNKQKNRRHDEEKTDVSPADIILKGHTSASEFALAVWCGKGPYEEAKDVHIASGGKNGTVLVWKFDDYQSAGRVMHRNVVLGEKGTGHNEQVEDVSFNGESSNILVSAGRDRRIICWDIRSPMKSEVVDNAHENDVNSCDNCGTNPDLVVTAGSDTKVKVWDRRKFSANGRPDPLHVFSGHNRQVNTVMWNRYVPDIIASGGEDAQVLVWDCKADAGVPLHDPRSSHNGLIFNHAGHSDQDCTIIDLEWLPNEHDPWCIATLSETVGEGGSSLQIWRMLNFIHRDREEVNADLVRYSANQ